ncbi:MAG: hypothetical protein ACYCQI_07950 [Gammaproteobacteria bacterium]
MSSTRKVKKDLPPLASDLKSKRKPKPNTKFTTGFVNYKDPVSSSTHKPLYMRYSHSHEGIIVQSKTRQKGSSQVSSPARLVRDKMKDVDGILSPSKTHITKSNPTTNSPHSLEKNTPKKTKFVRSFKAELILGNEDGKETIIEVIVFQSQNSALERKKSGVVSKNLDEIKSKMKPLPTDTYEVREIKITPAMLAKTKSESRKISDPFRADDMAATIGEEGAHEHSHVTQHRIGAHPALPVFEEKKQTDGNSKSEAKITFPSSYEHNSMRTLTPEHQIIGQYIKSGADFTYSNLIKLFGNVIDREYPQWRMGANKIKFSLIARNTATGKVTPAKQLLAVTERLFRVAFGTPKKETRKKKTIESSSKSSQAPSKRLKI